MIDGVVGLEPDHFAERGDCLVKLPRGMQCVAEVEVGRGVAGRETDRLADAAMASSSFLGCE